MDPDPNSLQHSETEVQSAANGANFRHVIGATIPRVIANQTPVPLSPAPTKMEKLTVRLDGVYHTLPSPETEYPGPPDAVSNRRRVTGSTAALATH